MTTASLPFPMIKAFLLFTLVLWSVNAQYRLKRVAFIYSGITPPAYIPCGDTDHDSLNEIIFPTLTFVYPSRDVWLIWEHFPINSYQLVFADTGPVYPYPPGIHTGNFWPNDIGDIDRDGLTDLVGPNVEQLQNPFYNVVTTQESPDYHSHPESLSWWYRYAYNEVVAEPFYFPPDLDGDRRFEILFWYGIFENITNNQNNLVYRNSNPAWSFTFGDFDLDGRKEFITAWLGSLGRVFIYENTGDNQYGLVRVDTVRIPNGLDVFSGNDLDSDGKPEFFVGFAEYVGIFEWDFYLYRWEATGDNTYTRILIDRVRRPDTSSTGRKSKCGDIDGDGLEELIWATPTKIFVYKATGNNQFQRIWEWTGDHGPYEKLYVNVYDLNQNGYSEVVISGSERTSIFEIEAVKVLRPNGGENFSGNTQELIRWQTFYPPRCDSLSLFYSIDNGRTYIPIITGIPGTDTAYLWTVPNVSSDSCRIRIIAYGPGWQYDDSDNPFRISAVGIEETANLDLKYLSLKISPNLFKAHATICFSLPTAQKISLKLYDITGKLIKTLSEGYKEPGIYKTFLNSKDLSSGVYFIRFQTETTKPIVQRLVVIK